MFNGLNFSQKSQLYKILAEGPGVACGKKYFIKKIFRKKNSNFFKPINMSVQKKFQPNRS